MTGSRKYPHSISKLSGLLLMILFILPWRFLLAQDESAIRPLIREADLKKLTKADGYKSEADQKIETSSNLNMQVFSVQSDPNMDEKTISKKVAQLEEQARQNQIEASALYEKCNEIKFSVYKQYIDEFWKTHEGQESVYLNAKLLEEQASDHYFQAINYRIDAKKMNDSFARIEKLTEADNLEIQAIQKQLSALAAYHGISEIQTPVETAQEVPLEEMVVADSVPSDTDLSVPVLQTEQSVISSIPDTTPSALQVQIPDNTPKETSLSGNISVNQSMIDAYNRYVATGQFADTTLTTGKIAGVTSFESDRVLQLWYEYVYGRNAFEEEQIPDTDVAMADSSIKKDHVTSTSPDPNEKEIGIVTDENIDKLIPADENVIFKVQIAANRTELTQRALSKMYYGNKNVEMINENGWFKYSVGDFDTFADADKFRKESGIKNGFVVAYRKGTRFVAGTAGEDEEQVTSSHQTYTPSGENRLPGGLIFRIQVAASRVPLSVQQMKHIYAGTYPVEMISEEGWFKYQLMGVRLYSDAVKIIRDIQTNGVFIVAYEDGVKIPLAEAVRKNRDLEKQVKTYGRKGIDDLEFHIQMAASRMAMQPAELSALYSGTEPVSVVYDDGWYKYHLKASGSLQNAEELKRICGVEKSFIVAYNRAAKISLYDAMQLLKQNYNH